MEEKQEEKKVRRIFTAEQKFEILKDIERCKTIKEGLVKHSAGGFGVLQVEAAVGGWSAGIVDEIAGR